MRILLLWAILGTLEGSSVSIVSAEEQILKIEYQGGHQGMDSKTEGWIVLNERNLEFRVKLPPDFSHSWNEPRAKADTTLLVIPLQSISDVTILTDRKDASLGAKLFLGELANTRRDELVTVIYDAPTTAEGVVFKTDKNMSSTVLAKINFYRRRASRVPANTDTLVLPQTMIPPDSDEVAADTTGVKH